MKNLVNYFDDININGLDDYILSVSLDNCYEDVANATVRSTQSNTTGMGNPKPPTEEENGSEPMVNKKKKTHKRKSKCKEEE